MPTDIFMRLPGEKRQRIRKAIRREFARVPMEEVSINRMIQEAGISRGSIYQYYADKGDMLEDVFADLRETMMDRGVALLKQHGGHPEAALVAALDYMTMNSEMSQWRTLCLNLFTHMRVQPRAEEERFRTSCLEAAKARLVPYVCWEDYTLPDPQPLSQGCLLEMLLSQWIIAVAYCLRWPEKHQQYRERLIYKYQLLKQGVCARKEFSC